MVLFGQKNSETDWENKPRLPSLVNPIHSSIFAVFGPKRTVVTSLGFPGLSSSQSVSGFFGPFQQENLEMDWDASLSFPGLSSQSVLGLFGPFPPENPEMDWDDKPGLPGLVIPVRSPAVAE